MVSSAAFQASLPGSLLAKKYRVERVLGHGGMGVVVLARHELLNQPVAVKLMLPEAATEPSSVERFLREARAAGRLESEHVARILDVGTLETGSPYIAMEFLEGEDLATYLEHYGPMPVAAAVDCILQAIDAVAEAHAHGIVHRDLKPANLFRVHKKDGTFSIKVLDFGIARHLADVKLTATSAMIGSPSYMAPEQVRAEGSIDTRADIWSLGVNLYELVTGTTPFLGAAASMVFVSILSGKYKPLSDFRADVSPELEAVVAKCLEQDRKSRFQDVVELANALVPLGGGNGLRAAERSAKLFRAVHENSAARLQLESVSTTAPTVAQETGSAWGGDARKRRRRRTMLTSIGMGAALAIGAGGIWFGVHQGNASSHATDEATALSATSGAASVATVTPDAAMLAAAISAEPRASSSSSAAAAAPDASPAALAASTTSTAHPSPAHAHPSGRPAAIAASATAGSPDLDSRY